MHFAAHDLHHIGGAVDCFLGHGLGERVFAQRLVEFNPQSAFGPVQQHAGHFLAVHVATDILRQAGNDRVPLLVGSTIVRCRRLGRGLSHGLGGSEASALDSLDGADCVSTGLDSAEAAGSLPSDRGPPIACWTSANTEAAPETTASAGFVGAADGSTACLPRADCAAYLREPDGRCDSDAAAPPACPASGIPDDGAAACATTPVSRPASRRAASSSRRMRGEIAPVMLASVALIVSAICVSAANPSEAAWRCRSSMFSVAVSSDSTLSARSPPKVSTNRSRTRASRSSTKRRGSNPPTTTF